MLLDLLAVHAIKCCEHVLRGKRNWTPEVLPVDLCGGLMQTLPLLCMGYYAKFSDNF